MPETLIADDGAQILEQDVASGILRVVPSFCGKPHAGDIAQVIVDAAIAFGEVATIDSMHLMRPIPSNVELRITRREVELLADERPLCTAYLTTEDGVPLCASFFPYETDKESINSYLPHLDIEPESASDSHSPVSSVCTYKSPSTSENATAFIFGAINDAIDRCTACSLENCRETLIPGGVVNAYTRYSSLDIGLILQTNRFTVVSTLIKVERRANGYLYFTTSCVVLGEDGERLCAGDVEKALVPSAYLFANNV